MDRIKIFFGGTVIINVMAREEFSVSNLIVFDFKLMYLYYFDKDKN